MGLSIEGIESTWNQFLIILKNKNPNGANYFTTDKQPHQSRNLERKLSRDFWGSGNPQTIWKTMENKTILFCLVLLSIFWFLSPWKGETYYVVNSKIFAPVVLFLNHGQLVFRIKGVYFLSIKPKYLIDFKLVYTTPNTAKF